ncbi:MAG: hypothetical protein JNM56_35230 [Planctomycetia bacterium]|nr:hypothetical protein [Planctomycetia bacterium]
MSATSSSSWGQATAAIFTAVVAPVLVSVILHGLNLAGSGPVQAEAAATAASTDARDILVSHGYGLTPAEARHDALRNALLTAMNPAVSPDTPQSDRQAVCELILREPSKVILRTEELGCRNESSFGKARFRDEICVEVARGPLVEQLRKAALPLR